MIFDVGYLILIAALVLATFGIIAGGWDKNKMEDGTIMVEIQAITGATSEVGFGYLSAR